MYSTSSTSRSSPGTTRRASRRRVLLPEEGFRRGGPNEEAVGRRDGPERGGNPDERQKYTTRRARTRSDGEEGSTKYCAPEKGPLGVNFSMYTSSNNIFV